MALKVSGDAGKDMSVINKTDCQARTTGHCTNAQEAVVQIKEKLGKDGFEKNLTIDYHTDRFGEDDFNKLSTLMSLSSLAEGYAGTATTCCLGNTTKTNKEL